MAEKSSDKSGKVSGSQGTATLETERHLSAGERAWEEKTLRPTLQKSPERDC